MDRLKITMASRNYDGLAPIIRGEVSIPGVDIETRVDTNVARIFAALYQGAVDISEMSMAELIYYTSRNQAELVAIPVFPWRTFRHGSLFVRKDGAPASAREVSGRRIGFQRWVQTAGVWMRGFLAEDYGVSPRDTQWYVATTHHWDDAPEDDIEPRDGSVIRRYTSPGVSGAENAHLALLAGEVDVIGVTEAQGSALLADGTVRRLFEDQQAEEAEYFRRTGIFPIMHVFAMRGSLVETHPELPLELCELFSRSKQLAQQRSSLPSWNLAWKDKYHADERALFGSDLWPFGVATNDTTIRKLVGYCYQQGIAARMLEPADLFAESTRDFVE